MRYLILLLIGVNFFTVAATRTMDDGSTLNITTRIDQSSWYELPWWSSNGYPKYSGALSTYTAKHIPVAVFDGVKDIYVYSQNHTGNLNLYIADDFGNKTLVHTSYGVTDPHDNAAVNIINDYVYVVVAARANSRVGYVYKSKEKYDISEFELVSQGWYAYPQLWPVSLLYTDYNDNNIRELWTNNRYCNMKLVEGGHYSVSYYDGEWLHLAYNYHTNNNLDTRQHIFYIKSKDGCNWFNKDDVELDLPLAGFESLALIYESDDYVYMKDIDVVDGEVKILTVDSNSYLPDFGTRNAYVTSLSGSRVEVSEVGHNYNTGGFVDGYVVLPTFGEFGYSGGDIEVFTMSGVRVLDAGFSYMYNYCRKVVNGSGCYVSEAPSSSVNQGAYIRKITIE